MYTAPIADETPPIAASRIAALVLPSRHDRSPAPSAARSSATWSGPPVASVPNSATVIVIRPMRMAIARIDSASVGLRIVGARPPGSAGRSVPTGASATDDGRSVRAGDEAADLCQGADRGPLAGLLGELGRGLDLRSHRARGERGSGELARRGLLDPCLGRRAPVAVDAVDVGRHHEQVGLELPGEQGGGAILVDDDLRPDDRPGPRLVHRRNAAAAGADHHGALIEQPADRADLEDPLGE